MRAEFDETLVTGNDMIDSQHKELIDRDQPASGKLRRRSGKDQGSEDAGLSSGLHGFPL